MTPRMARLGSTAGPGVCGRTGALPRVPGSRGEKGQWQGCSREHLLDAECFLGAWEPAVPGSCSCGSAGAQ